MVAQSVILYLKRKMAHLHFSELSDGCVRFGLALCLERGKITAVLWDIFAC